MVVRAVRLLALAVGICTVAYAAYVTEAFVTYGRAQVGRGGDALLDEFMPVYDVRDAHQIRVGASAALTMQAARRVSFDDSPVIRAVFRAREFILNARRPQGTAQRQAFVDFAQSIGWRMLANEPGKELVFGAVTQPWNANVVFNGIAPQRFRAFNTPGYVKIVWTLRADAASRRDSIFITETRAVATDETARERFRRYWATYSPGIVLIRLAALHLIRSRAEHDENVR